MLETVESSSCHTCHMLPCGTAATIENSTNKYNVIIEVYNELFHTRSHTHTLTHTHSILKIYLQCRESQNTRPMQISNGSSFKLQSTTKTISTLRTYWLCAAICNTYWWMVLHIAFIGWSMLLYIADKYSYVVFHSCKFFSLLNSTSKISYGVLKSNLNYVQKSPDVKQHYDSI